jgi:TatD DNase family protein
MIFVDSHSHIFDKDFDTDRAEVIARADSVGVKYHILPNIDSSYSDRVLEVATKFKGICFPLIGLHPTSVAENYEDELLHVEQMLQKAKYYGIGEIGIDLYWDKTFFEQQKKAFRHQLQIAKQEKLPVVIHSRNSYDEIFEMVDQENDSNLRGVFHAFTGTFEQYQRIIDYGGFKIGIGGIVTYKNGGLDKVVAQMKLSDIVLETDSPYLTPTPKRGQRNEGQNIIIIAQKISEILNISMEEIADVTTKNSLELFNIKA